MLRFVCSGLLLASAATLIGCTADVCVAPCGGSGGAGSTMSSTSGSTSAKTSSQSGAATSTTGQSTASSAVTVTSSDAATTTSTSTGMSSTSSGVGAVYLPCGGLQDDFNGYGDDATFQVSGQTNGDWAETGGGGDLVRLLASGRIYTQGTSGGAMLYSKASLPVAGSSCAISVRLIANGGPVGFFGFLDDVISPSKSGTISCEANGVNLCAVTTFGVPSGTFTLPIKLGIVVDGGVAYGVYESPTGWARLPNAPGISSDSLIGPAAHAVFGHSTTTADTIWDDFSVDAIPTTAILN